MQKPHPARLMVWSAVGSAALVMGWILWTSDPAQACPEFLERFKVVYPQAVNTKLTTYPIVYPTNSCAGLCHTGGVGGDGNLNRYGARVYETFIPPNTSIICGSAETMALASTFDFTLIEAEDSDGDGFTNIQEINAGTFPGYVVDRPRAAPSVSSTASVSANELDPDPTSNAATAVTTVLP